MKIYKLLTLVFLLLTSKTFLGQFKSNISELSISIINNQYGLPFIRFVPINPGASIGLTFLEKTQSKTDQKVTAELGYFSHNISNSIYLKTIYNYQFKLKQTLGVNGYAGLGYMHSFYPGDGYVFDEASKTYAAEQINQAFVLSNIGLGISYIKPTKLQPFIKYEINMAGLNSYNIFTQFILGLDINLKK